MRLLILLLLLLKAKTGLAGEYSLKLMELKSFTWEYWEYVNPPHDPYLTPIDQKLVKGSAVNPDIDVVNLNNQYRLYFNNHVHMDSTEAHVKHVGWQWELGVGLFNKVEFFQAHHSRHVMEETRPGIHFPVYDRRGIRINLMMGE